MGVLMAVTVYWVLVPGAVTRSMRSVSGTSAVALKAVRLTVPVPLASVCTVWVQQSTVKVSPTSARADMLAVSSRAIHSDVTARPWWSSGSFIALIVFELMIELYLLATAKVLNTN